MKTLILGTCYLGETAQPYGLRMISLWAALAKKLNPECDILIIDSASPCGPKALLDAAGFNTVCILDEHGNTGSIGMGGNAIAFFQDNAGHLNYNGVDGFGRAFCKGIELAAQWGYDYVAYMDCDIIFTRPVAPIIEKMARSGVKAACPFDCQYSFLENGLMFLNVAYLRDSNFIENYNWKDRSRTNDPNAIPEMVFERLLEDVIFTLPLRGLRDDRNLLTVNNLEGFSPYGLDYLTHVKDFAVYERFLEMKGIEL